MATRRTTVDHLLSVLVPAERFTVRSMFGEYAVYADGKVVALVCDDRLFVKIIPASAELETLCEKASPFPGAKAYYLVSEEQWTSIRWLSKMLLQAAATLSVPKPKKKVAAKKR